MRSGRSGYPGRREGEVEFAEPPQDVRRLIGVPAIAGRPVLDLVDLDVRQPVQDALDGDAALHPGERSARTRVHAAGERHVLADVLSVELEFVRVVEAARIAV